MIDWALAQKTADLLNDLYRLDAPAIGALVAVRVPCCEALSHHPTVQSAAQHGGFSVGLLGILNGLAGADKDGWGGIAATFDDAGNLMGFRVLDERKTGKEGL